jgi:hypothetical protein
MKISFDTENEESLIIVTSNSILLNEKQVSILTNISVHTLRDHRYKGLDNGLPYVKICQSVRYPLKNVIEFIKNNQIEPVRIKKKHRPK